MSSQFSFETINRADSILNKEFNHISEPKLSSPSWFDKDHTRSHFASTDTLKSTFTGPHHSRRSSNCDERSARVTFKDTPHMADHSEGDTNFKMQKQLLTLQARVIELEMKMSSMNSPVSRDQVKKTYTPSNHISLANTLESSKLNSNNGSPVSRNREVELKSSLRTTVNHSERTATYSGVSPILQQDNLAISRISHQGSERRILARSPSGLSMQTVDRSTVKKSVKRESRGRFEQSMSRTSCDLTIKTNYSSTSRSGVVKKDKENMSRMYQECEEESVNLHKLINKYKREYNEDKVALVKERVRGNELAEKVEKMNRNMKKLEKAIVTASKSQGSYGELMESFGKSENIRKQQKSLIESLSKEVQSLKGENQFSERSEYSFKAVSTLREIKSRRKATKAF